MKKTRKIKSTPGILFIGLLCGSGVHGGCTGTENIGSAGTNSSGDTDSDTDSDTDVDTDPDVYVHCPSLPPTDGEDCSEYVKSDGDGYVYCSWGDDPRYHCRIRGSCYTSSPSWRIQLPSNKNCGDLLPPGCPTDRPTPRDPCDQDDLWCQYSDGEYCLCTTMDPYPPYPLPLELDDPIWQCISPPTVEGCPSVQPNAGTECSLPDKTHCEYTCQQNLQCKDGAWFYLGDNCPICAAPDTPIATPHGERPISELKAGDLVYSVEANRTVVVPLKRVSRTRVVDHGAVEVVLEDGNVLLISEGHPTADGREFRDLTALGMLDNQGIISARVVPYPHDYTYDILPDASTGYYYAAGALIGSTLTP